MIPFITLPVVGDPRGCRVALPLFLPCARAGTDYTWERCHRLRPCCRDAVVGR